MQKRGLTQKEAEKRLHIYGFNEIKDISKRNSLKIFLRQIKNNFIVYLLFVAMFISFFIGKSVTGYTILIVIFMVIIVGFIQEYRAEKAISALKEMLVPTSLVIRDGKEQQIDSKNIVLDDILILRTGERVPADCLLLEEQELRVNESILTGEAKEVRKKVNSTENLLFMGTFVVNGHCVAKVTQTGMNTQFGKVAELISTTEKELPLQKKVNKIAKNMVLIAITISLLTGFIMLARSSTLTQDVIFSTLVLVIALCVSAFPEGFPVVLITTLASGAHRMAKQNAIVNRMSIIETLGETTVICADKTGTITKGEMTVKRIFANNTFFEVTGTGYMGKGDFLFNNKKINLNKEPLLELLLRNCVLCNDAIIERSGNDSEFKTIGSSTESAILILAAKAGLFREDLKYQRVEELPFNSDRKMMSVVYRENKDKIVYSKGALEYLIKKCKFIEKNSGIYNLTSKEKLKILESNKEMTLKSLRTIGFAYKKVKSTHNKNIEDDLIFIGFVGLEDPAREEVKDSITQCYRAGIKVKMITGDNKETARAIAKEIGLFGKLMEGYELDKLTDDKLTKIIDSIAIFARVKPEHKLRIVSALKANGEIVTMTGDGVNDAPALKEAHIGIAMGKKGTDVCRSVADLTLKDDNFKTIVLAISEGRTIFKNIQKFAPYQLSCNFAELAILFIGVLLAPFLGWQIPLLVALQILFVNLVTDNLPAITLGLNPASDDSMLDPPRKKSQILSKELLLLLAFTGSVLTLLVLFSFFISFNILGTTIEYARTVALFSLIGLEIVSAFNFRSFRKGVLNKNLLANPYLFCASIISLLATLAIIYSPLNKVFETVPLKLDGIIIVVLLSLFLAIVFDLLKYFNNRKNFFDLAKI